MKSALAVVVIIKYTINCFMIGSNPYYITNKLFNHLTLKDYSEIEIFQADCKNSNNKTQ